MINPIKNLRLRDILLLCFVLLSTIPLFVGMNAVNNYFSSRYENQLREELRALSSIAESRIQSANNRLIDNIQLIASRTKLRISLSECTGKSDEEQIAWMRRIIQDANKSVTYLQDIIVFDVEGRFLVSASSEPHDDIQGSYDKTDVAFIELVALGETVGAIATKSLSLNGNHIGWIRVICSSDFLLQLTRDRTGLGKTGEWVIAKRGPDGDAVYVNPLLHDPDAPFKRTISRHDHDAPVIQALNGYEGILDYALDYRHVEVMAATRHIEEQDWGLVVKIDRTEVGEVSRQIRLVLVMVELFLIIIAGIMGVIIARFIANPIENLTHLTAKVSNGDLDHRASPDGWREAKELAVSFNTMADSLKDITNNLQKRVDERTGELKRANKILEKLAMTDELSGLFNRRYFMDKLQNEVSRAQRYQHPLTILMLDLDHFKNVNDTYGHQTGDEVLKHFSGQLIHATRNIDVVGRMGGEEFAIILPDTDSTCAVKVGERLRKEVDERRFETDSVRSLRITISVGVATYHPDMVDHDELLRCADKALYEAKHSGRNKVCLYDQRRY